MLLAGRPVLVDWASSPSSLSENMGSVSVTEVLSRGAGGHRAWERVEARASWGLTEVAGRPVVEIRLRLIWCLGLVDQIPEREAVMCPSAVAGLCGWLRLSIFAVRNG